MKSCLIARFNSACHGLSIKQFSLGSNAAYAFVHFARGSQKEQPASRAGPKCREIVRIETANSKVSIPAQRSSGEDPPFPTSLFHGAPTTIQWATAIACPTRPSTSTARQSSRGCIANVSSCASGMPNRWPLCSDCCRRPSADQCLL